MRTWRLAWKDTPVVSIKSIVRVHLILAKRIGSGYRKRAASVRLLTAQRRIQRGRLFVRKRLHDASEIWSVEWRPTRGGVFAPLLASCKKWRKEAGGQGSLSMFGLGGQGDDNQR